MDKINWSQDRPNLRTPTLIVAFEGWNDAGESSTSAAKHIQERLVGESLATIDPEPFYDFTETRPLVKLGKEGRQIKWPSNEFYAVKLEDHKKDLIVLVGTEPQLHWRTYIEQILAIVDEFAVELVVSLGALIAEVVHTRPATVYSSSYDPELIDLLNLEPSNYEGPTGIVGVLQDQLRTADVSCISLWATIPGYVPHMTSPKAALALVQRVNQLLEVDIPTSLLEVSASNYEQQISELVSEDEETTTYVQELEQNYDESMGPESGAELIEELEQFLKNREK